MVHPTLISSSINTAASGKKKKDGKTSGEEVEVG